MTFIQASKRLFSPVKDDPVAFLQNITEAVFLSLYTIFSIEVTKILLKDIERWDVEHFYFLIKIYVIISIFLISCRFFLRVWWWARISLWWVARLSEKYLYKFVQADGNAIERIGTGRFISIMDRWLYQWMDVLFELTFTGVINIIMVLYAIYTISQIHIISGIVSFLLMIIAWIVATYANIWMTKKRYIRRREQNEANHQTVIALMSKNELLQNNGLEKITNKIWHHLNRAKYYQEIVNIGFIVIEEFPRFIFLILRVGIYVLVMEKVFSTGNSIVDLGIFVTIITIAEKNLNEFLHMFRNILREFSSISILWDTFDSLPSIKWYDSWKIFNIKNGGIEINSITYGYNEKKVFENFSLNIEKGKKTALVGASGGGKTTLMKLIAGYLHPDSGNISVMGNRLDKTALKTYYPHIGYLTQEPSVFDATIRENLVSAVSTLSSWGMKDLPQKDGADSSQVRNDKKSEKELEEKLEKALRLAHCDFVFDLEHWLDTEIGERGVRLSWGQKQRLAIAKIFLKNPEIILLDEPTSALDSFSEEAITEALDELFQWRTVIIVAHRLQTVKKADDIIVIEWGKVAERGNHEMLVLKKWIYSKMLELQSGF